MAEAVIVGIAEKIVANLVPRAIEQVGMLWGIKHELKALENTVSTLQAVLDDAEKQYYQNRQIQVWLEKLKDAFYEAQDVLEEFTIEATRRELRGHNEMMKEVRTFFSCSNQLAFKLKMIYKVRAVRVKIEAIKADKGIHLNQRSMDPQIEQETHSFIPKGEVIGRDDDKKAVMEFLLNLDVQDNISILPIVGIGGLGKTALAKYVYEDSKFDLKMWVCVSTKFDVQKIVKKMLACAKMEEPTEVTMELLQRKLRAEIEGKKYLLVLDDVWNTDQETWRSLKNLLVGSAKGSKILITTCIPLVAQITGTFPPHLLKSLSESASLDLLMQTAGRKEEIQDREMLAIAREIARKCYGVPLVVRTVGGLLSFKKSKQEWSKFKDEELPEVCQNGENIKLVLRLSYNHLPSHLKQCFAFCSLFPKDYEMKTQTLVDLWVAEGFIRPSQKRRPLEDIARKYFMDLLWSNFFQEFKKDPYTMEETCKMHDLMHDLACLVAGTECWVAWNDKKSISERTRHISVGDLPISRLKASPLRTFLSTMPRERSEAELHQLIQSFKRLRILDLHIGDITTLPRSICKLKHLTYLDLSSNWRLKRLPNSITRLQNLQTLNLNNCFALEELPRCIRKLVSLRNLNIDGCLELCYVPHGLGQLSALHRLTRFILPKDKALAKNGCRLGELNGLNNLQGSLRIENLGSVTDAVAESRSANLMGKHSLESLALEWGEFDTDDAVIVDRDEALLDGLRPHSNLQKLRIDGYKGENFSRWMMDSLVSSLPKLVEVRFFGCKRCKHLPPLGQLPHLKTLEIWGLTELEYIESDHSSTSTASFPSLLQLKISKCMKLKAMPPAPHLEQLGLSEAHPALINMIVGVNKLKSLVIGEMDFLECLPEECWKSLASLESLCISKCPRLTSLSTRPPPPLGTRHQSNQVDLDSSDSEELDLSKYHESSSGNNNHHLILQLHSLREVELSILPKLASLPQWLLWAGNLEVLYIQECEELDICKDESGNIILNFHGGLQSLRSVTISYLPKLASLPPWLLRASNLESLSLFYCRKLDLSKDENGNILNFHGGLQSLWSVYLDGLPKLASLPQWLLWASNLESLSILRCEELDLSKDENGNILNFHGGLQSLRSVNICSLPKLASLPQWLLQAGNLERLRLWEWSNLKELPEQIEALQSLQLLEIRGCPSLTSLPEGMRRLASLAHLEINFCPELERRCKRDAGEDWDKIAHIPEIHILGL